FNLLPQLDMDIVTYVSSGILTHEDNMGNKEEIQAGQMQRLTAGSGIVHSEVNEHDKPEHNIQIWILPDKKGRTPSYQIRSFDEKEQSHTLELNVLKDWRKNYTNI